LYHFFLDFKFADGTKLMGKGLQAAAFCHNST